MATTLRILVTIFILALLMQMLVPWIRFLPPELQAWLTADQEASYAIFENGGPVALLALLIIISLYIALIASCIGLYLLKMWGVWLFGITFLIVLLISSIGGPYAFSGFESLVNEVTTIVASAIITVGLCTDAIPRPLKK